MSAKRPEFLVEWENGIVDVDAGLSVKRVVQCCAEAGVLFPMAPPFSSLTLRQWVAASPPFADAFVASASLRDAGGLRVQTPRVPRAAMGADLFGAALLPRPALECERLRIRAWPREAIQMQSVNGAPHEVIDGFRAQLNTGGAFWVEASASRLVVISGHVEGDAPAPIEVPALEGTEPPRSGVSQARWAGEWIGGALLSGHRVMAAPFMGRMGIYTDEKSAAALGEADAAEAFSDLVAALHAGGKGA